MNDEFLVGVYRLPYPTPPPGEGEGASTARQHGEAIRLLGYGGIDELTVDAGNPRGGA